MKQTTKDGIDPSYHGTTIKATVSDLREVLGQPECSDNSGENKINYLWIMETDGGEVFTFYDWKERRPIGENEEIEWHIGGKNEAVTIQAKMEIEKALAENKAANIEYWQRCYDAARTREENLKAEVTRLRSLIIEFVEKMKAL